MSIAASRPAAAPELVELAREATAAVDALLADAVARVRERVVVEGHAVARLFDREQRATHGLAWFATYVEAIRQLAAYAERMAADGALGELEEHLVRIALGEYLAQMIGGIPMSQGEIVRPSDLGLSAAQVAARINPMVEGLIASGNTPERRARLVELMRASHGATVGACGLDETLESIRDEMRKFADSEVIGARPAMAPDQQLYPARRHRADVGARRVRADHSRRVRRHGARQGIHVRGLRGALARLYRRRLARHALGDRRRTDPRQRHRRAEGEMAAQDRFRRGAADRGVHRAQYRLRSRLDQDARGARGQCLQGLRQQDLDHASGARRPDDAAGAHQSEGGRPPRPVHAAGRKAARRR